MSAKNLASHVSTRKTPQSSPIPGKAQIQNSAGGYSFQVDDWSRLSRFLVLGSEKGSYYATERDLTIQNVECLQRCADADFPRALQTVVDVSVAGRAPKNDYAILALAILASRPAPQSTQALAELNRVCRIGTHLFQFCEYLKAFRGRGRAVKTALQNWYVEKGPLELARQVTKYQQRNGWSHRDLLRLCKPRSSKLERADEIGGVFSYVVGKPWDAMIQGDVRDYLEAVEQAKAAETVREIVKLIEIFDLPREVIPTRWLNEVKVWDAMLPRMPMTAMVRNLGKMASIGLTKPLSRASVTVADKLGDVEEIRKARLHPFAVLLALTTYRSGRGFKGSLSWSPDAKIVDALDGAFYLAFQTVVPTGKNHLLALDVSGSMNSPILGSNLSARVGAAAMAMVAVKTEANTHVTAFASGGTFNRPSQWSRSYGSSHDAGIIDMPFSPKSRLDDVVRQTSNLPFGGTDCALPMLYATERKLEVDAFVVYTDNETWHGAIHPCQALNEYRQKMGRPAKLIVVGMVTNEFSIADPNDGGMLDVVGFDASAPVVMADFVRG